LAGLWLGLGAGWALAGLAELGLQLSERCLCLGWGLGWLGTGWALSGLELAGWAWPGLGLAGWACAGWLGLWWVTGWLAGWDWGG
jgi:hypothetical protein